MEIELELPTNELEAGADGCPWEVDAGSTDLPLPGVPNLSVGCFDDAVDGGCTLGIVVIPGCEPASLSVISTLRAGV